MSAVRHVGLIFGGRSVEHEVSVISARGVAAALRQSRLTCVPLAVTTEGLWLAPDPSRRILDGSAPRVEADRDDDLLALDPGGNALLRCRPGKPSERVELDVVFPLIHGWGGEDGRLQAALDLARIPFVGSGVTGSAVGMDKTISKVLLEASGLAVGPWLGVSDTERRADPLAVRDMVERRLGYPVFVKPCNGGSSVGISKVSGEGGLQSALDLAFDHDREVVIERAIDAREIECAVLGNDSPEASVLGEIIPSGEFYDYAAKYVDDSSELLIPADLEAALADRIRGLSITAFKALKLRGFARVDFLLDRETGQPYINEANTLPGFTPISMFPKLWEASGLSYMALVERLVGLALESAEPRHASA
jgi:D-alanine-D-alanine ligase